MFHGKTRVALHLLSDECKGAVLQLNDPIDTGNKQTTVRDVLASKHPPDQSAHPDAVIDDDPPEIHPVLFESLDAAIIRSSALRTSGAAGPSGIDALGWRRLCTSFKSSSMEPHYSLALVAKRLCTELVDPASIAPFVSCRLIVLDKNPIVRPIGNGDTARRIISKAILNIFREDIQEAAGCLQLCAGQISGNEEVVHAVRVQKEETKKKLKHSCW